LIPNPLDVAFAARGQSYYEQITEKVAAWWQLARYKIGKSDWEVRDVKHSRCTQAVDRARHGR
jgi:hypothetical protein